MRFPSLTACVVAVAVAVAGLAHADHVEGARFGVGAGARVAGDDVDPAVIARVAWETVALEPTLAVGLGKITKTEDALGYDAEGDDRSRTLDAGLGVRVLVARRERLAFGVVGRVAAGYAWNEVRGAGPLDDFATRTTHVGLGGGLRVEWEVVGPLSLLVDAHAELVGWTKVEREGNGLTQTDRGWSLGVDLPGVVSALALVTF